MVALNSKQSAGPHNTGAPHGRPDRDRLEELIDRLNLTQLEKESGLYVVKSLSTLRVSSTDGSSPASNCLYYALTRDYPQNHLHWLMPDDHHILIEGGPADYYFFHPDGTVEKQTLGRDLARGHTLIVVHPGGSQKAIRLHADSEYLLVGSVVTPAWTPERVSFGAGQAFIARYSGKADWATPEFLQALIGPNFQEST